MMQFVFTSKHQSYYETKLKTFLKNYEVVQEIPRNGALSSSNLLAKTFQFKNWILFKNRNTLPFKTL